MSHSTERNPFAAETGQTEQLNEASPGHEAAGLTQESSNLRTEIRRLELKLNEMTILAERRKLELDTLVRRNAGLPVTALAFKRALARIVRNKLIPNLVDTEELKLLIGLVFEIHLKRRPDPEAITGYLGALRGGMTLSDFIQDVASSPEANSLRVPSNAAINAQQPSPCFILGTNQPLTKGIWNKRASDLGIVSSHGTQALKQPVPPPNSFQHTGKFRVTAIASLYRGGEFIDTFLKNITSQTIFNQSELIIIDANSPDNEARTILEYQKTFPNIIYHRFNYRIGIYEAWNEAIKLARGQYITNTNLDDLRRIDSFELQAGTLDRHAFSDVVYQDFFFSLDPSFNFEDVARMGFKSDLPLVTAHSLRVLNSPHNAPMWRRKLHDELGLFDTSYKSAGDFEFWMRCAEKNKTFFKLNDPHVVYFHNPHGVSTAAGTPGLEEAGRIRAKYDNRIISPYLSNPQHLLAGALGVAPDASVSAYDLVQRELVSLRRRTRTHPN